MAAIAVGPSPPSVRLSVDGGDCGGDEAFVVLKRDFAAWDGGLRVRAKLNIDQPTGGPKEGLFQGGIAVSLVAPTGFCGFHISWANGIPHVNSVLHAAGNQTFLGSADLLETSISAGQWLDLELAIRHASPGSQLAWSVVGGKAGAMNVPECTWSRPEKVQLFANCSKTPLDVTIDDVAVWMTTN
jgi:hypothetical protein